MDLAAEVELVAEVDLTARMDPAAEVGLGNRNESGSRGGASS